MKLTTRCALFTLPVIASALFAITAAAANAEVGVTVNGSAVDITPAPIVEAGRVFVPLRGVFEQLGASVVYSNGTINATGNGRDISLQIGLTQATVNGQVQTIDVAPFIVGESTYVPLRFVSEALGDSVHWDDADSIAAIDTAGGAADYYSPGTASYVDTAPPPIPVYDQPYVPQPNYLWQPGYWAWGSYGYYWVPGTWVEAPQPGYLWTPGYWQGSNVGFHWNPGYWAPAVGFYGGVNYGAGYYGNGYDGGQWSNNAFRYNSYVTHVNTTNIRNVYVDRNVYVNNSTTRVSYNGGRYGVQARPTSQQLSVARERHVGMTSVQQQHVRIAEQDDRLRASVNHNRPPVLAVARPLSAGARPAGFVPVKPADRVNPLANVAPVRAPAVHAARPVGRPAVTQAVRPAAPAGQAVQSALPPAHIPIVHTPAPVVRGPAPHQAATVRENKATRTPPVQSPPVPKEPAYHVPAVHEESPNQAPLIHQKAATARVPAVYAAPPRRAPAAALPASAPGLHAVTPPRAAPKANRPPK